MGFTSARLLGWCAGALALGRVAAADLPLTDDHPLALPLPGSYQLRLLAPAWLELTLINAKPPNPARVENWDFVDTNFVFTAPALSEFSVQADGRSVAVQAVGFKRRPLYAPVARYDLRVQNALYLQLATPIADARSIRVDNPNATLWPTNLQFAVTVEPLRHSPVIHVNQEGYVPGFPKKAMVGYYLGNLGELDVDPAPGFTLVDAQTGQEVFRGALSFRPDVGYPYTPLPYQKVLEADFTSFNTPGAYRLAVPGLGASHPFVIDEGIALNFARAYALGLYHQRCGTNNALPFTRFTHDPCHTAPADVPLPQSDFQFTWNTIALYSANAADNPRHTAPPLRDPASCRYPFIRTGKLDVSGGHHDAGDYSKYTINSASLIHHLVFAVDCLPGVAALDNLGLPESGDGISDLLQEAKWEADFLAKLQDDDGGFYFLVYPREREYESDVLPDQGDPQVVWPKTTAVTAAAVAALAQMASSPCFQRHYPDAAPRYMMQALMGWRFLTNAIARFGKDGAYQKITHYGDTFMHDDELAWAACELFLATGDPAFQQQLIAWFDPADPETWHWTWQRMFASYGAAIRSYAFAVAAGKRSPGELDPVFLGKCREQIRAAGDDMLRWAQQNAYGTSFPEETKRFLTAGWYFSSDQAFDLTVAYQLDPRPEYLEAFLSNLNYEGGCNPVDMSYVTGLGWRRQREIVHQYALNDRRVLPPSGLPLGNLQAGFSIIPQYFGEMDALCFPANGWGDLPPYPYYDRWTDTFNVTTEFVVANQARSLASIAFLATLTSARTQAWHPPPAFIDVPAGAARVGAPFTVTLRVPGLDLSGARIVWEGRDQEPAFGAATFAMVPVQYGAQWIEAEAYWPDGRRVFATNSVFAEEDFGIVRISRSNEGAVTLRWASAPGSDYEVQYKGTLNAGTWNSTGGTIRATGPVTSWTEPHPTAPQRFYRVVALP